MFDLERLRRGTLVLIPKALFLPLGMYFTGRVKRSLFDRIIIALTAVLSARLFYAAWGG